MKSILSLFREHRRAGGFILLLRGSYLFPLKCSHQQANPFDSLIGARRGEAEWFALPASSTSSRITSHTAPLQRTLTFVSPKRGTRSRTGWYSSSGRPGGPSVKNLQPFSYFTDLFLLLKALDLT